MSVQPRLLNLSTFINEHLNEDLTLEVLAQRISLSPFHFHRKFRAYFGESLHQHIKRLRLERSAHDLLYRLRPVSQVALTSGYKTLSAFSHAFSAQFGIAPTRFRDAMQSGSLAAVDQDLRQKFGEDWLAALAPRRVETAAERAVIFLRASLDASRSVDGICAALDQLRTVAGGQDEFVVSSSDLFGIDTAQTIRVDVGRDVAYIDPEVRARFGQEVIPGGRYAVFEYRGEPANLADVARAIYRFWLPNQTEKPRATPHYVTFSGGAEAGALEFRIYVPLLDAVGMVASVPEVEFAEEEDALMTQS